ncbi:MAG TPA: hypothetical protein VGP50_09880 [Stellaceae bacterium]|jgi:hypothetical protein|nr:hypothetical protein [Stellaceae bacterium]
MSKYRFASRILFAAVVALLPLAARADLPGEHPYYLHALSDLRTARWMLEHRPGDAAVSGQEDVAVQQIDAALGEIKRASIDDGKDLKDHPAVDVPKDHPGRLHKAAELLRKVHQDVDREEDDPTAQGLKHRSLEHVEAALHATDQAIKDAETHK